MTADDIDSWLALARAEAHKRGIELHVLPDDSFELRRGAFTERPVGRVELAVALRRLGCQVPDAPP